MSGRVAGPVGASTGISGNYGSGSGRGAPRTTVVIATPISLGLRNKLAIKKVDSPVARPSNSPAGGSVSPASGIATGGCSYA